MRGARWPLALCITPAAGDAAAIVAAVDALGERLPSGLDRREFCVLVRRPADDASSWAEFVGSVAVAVARNGMALGLNVGSLAPDVVASSPVGDAVRWLQLPERAPPVGAWRHAGAIVARSVHDAAGLQRAVDEGADAAVLSPVFATASKPGTVPLGLPAFGRLVAACPLPVWALGGIDASRIAAVGDAGAAGVAAIRAAWSVGTDGLHSVDAKVWNALRVAHGRANGR